jgi:hypothetical protein
MAKLARHLSENVPPELVTVRGPPAQLRSEEDVPNRKRRSMSVDLTSPQNTPIAPKREVSSQTLTNSDWVGEWNRSDIRDVQRELTTMMTVINWYGAVGSRTGVDAKRNAQTNTFLENNTVRWTLRQTPFL